MKRRLRMSEADVTRTVLDTAAAHAWPLQYHTRDSRGSASGFPDWVFLRAGRLVALELKGERGVVSIEQAAWITLLNTVPGVEAAIIRPADVDLAMRLLDPRAGP